MPPPWRNHLVPTAGDTPTAAAASSDSRPLAISLRNSRSTSRLCDGAPGDFIGDRPVNAVIHPAGLPTNASVIMVLRGPVEPPWLPASVWCTRPVRSLTPCRRRVQTACSNVSNTSSVLMLVAARQPPATLRPASIRSRTFRRKSAGSPTPHSLPPDVRQESRKINVGRPGNTIVSRPVSRTPPTEGVAGWAILGLVKSRSTGFY